MQRIDKNTRRSRAVVTGGIVYMGGQVADDWNADIRTQTRQALARIDAILTEAGSSRDRLISATIWLKDMADYEGMNEVWDAWIDRDNPPTRACGEVRMADDRLLVEIIATAAV